MATWQRSRSETTTTPAPGSGPPGRPDPEAAIAGLVNEHGAAMIAYATRLTGDRYQAEDVVQEALVRAWQRLDTLDATKGSVRGWLLTVVRNIVIDQARAKASRPREVATTPSRPPVEADHSEAVTDLIAMSGLLGGLSAEQRSVLVELYYRGRTVTETAAELGIPAGTVKSRSFTALRALRGRLDSASA